MVLSLSGRTGCRTSHPIVLYCPFQPSSPAWGLLGDQPGTKGFGGPQNLLTRPVTREGRNEQVDEGIEV